MSEEINAPRGKQNYEKHTHTFHPTLYKWLLEVAEQYGGNASAALNSFILYDRGIRNAKLKRGEKHTHNLTPGIMEDPLLLEAAIKEIESDEPGFNAMTWLEIQKRKAADAEGKQDGSEN